MRILGFIVIVATCCSLLHAGESGPEKVAVCHNPACPEGQIHGNTCVAIEVNASAVDAHLDHGDTVGSCDENEACNEDGGDGDGDEEDDECNEVECLEDQACIVGVCVDLPKDGQDGENGQDGTQGPGGSNGQDGEDGLPGLDGSSCTVVEEDSCATVKCNDGTSATVCGGQDGEDGQDGSSCIVESVNGGALISCDSGISVLVENGEDVTGFDDDNDGVTNDIDQCSGTPVGLTVDEVGCPIVQDQPPAPDEQDACVNRPLDLFGNPGDATIGDGYCGLCGTQCGLAMLMIFMGLSFMKRRNI